VLWADGSHGIEATGPDGTAYSRNDGRWYAQVLAGLRENPGCVGAHLCGAYIRNRCRKRGLLDPFENPDTENVTLIAEANRQTTAWVNHVIRN